MKWDDYEEITKGIYEALGKHAGVSIVGHGNNFKIKGKSGVEHQIDVLTSHSDGIHQYLTDIECKYWANKVDKDIIMKVKSIVEDCYFSKGIIVSKMGFTDDAITYAASVSIGLVILREPIEEDWKGRIKTIVVNMHMHFPEILRFEQIITKKYEDIEELFIDTEKYYYIMPDGSKKLIREIIDEYQKLLTFDNVDKEIDQEVSFPQGTILYGPEDRKIADINSVKIKGILRRSTHTIEVNGEDRVWLIMKSLFENKQFIISKNGKITEVSK